MRISGYAAVFNSLSADLGDFKEKIAPGAFRRTLKDKHPIFAVHHHNMAHLLGSTRSGTLKLSEDNFGLKFELVLPETSLGREIHELVSRRDLQSMSFSFSPNGVKGEEWRQTSRGIERTLRDVSLTEVSTVALPAYAATIVSARHSTETANKQDASVVDIHQAARNRMLSRLLSSKHQAV